MAASKLSIYNSALGLIGERKLASLTEDREPRRVLDDFYSDTIAYCLEMGQWQFARKSDEIAASTSVTPEFGFANAFRKPTDWLRTLALSSDPTFSPPLLRYREENGYWYADEGALYVEYISNASGYGLNLSSWSKTFEDFVTIRLAGQICTRISGAESKREMLERKERKALAAARDHNAAGSAPIFPPRGSWVTSRGGGSSNNSRWDRQS